MRLICWIVGHRALWIMGKGSLMLTPKCKRCNQPITGPSSAHLDPFFL